MDDNDAHDLLTPVLEAAVGLHTGAATVEDCEAAIDAATLALCGEDGEHSPLPGWTTVEALGRRLVHVMDLDAEEAAGADLPSIVAGALSALVTHVGEMLEQFEADPAAAWDPHGLDQLSALHDFAAACFAPGDAPPAGKATLRDHAWRPVGKPPPRRR